MYKHCGVSAMDDDDGDDDDDDDEGRDVGPAEGAFQPLSTGRGGRSSTDGAAKIIKR